MIITIDEKKCTKCNICVSACPIAIIGTNNNKFPVIPAEKEKFCLYCGHCESVCPDNALVHELSEKAVAPQNRETGIIDPVELGKYIRSRRSIRNYQSKPVEMKILEELMDVVRYSPTGTNRQTNQWVIVYNKDVVDQLASATVDWMRTVGKNSPTTAAVYNFPAIVAAYERGNDRVCRNAPHLIISYAPAKYAVGAKDTTIATTILDMLLPSYGLGSCWAGFLYMAFEAVPDMKKIIGLNETHKIHNALMIGYPKYKYYKVPYRNKADVKWVE